MYIHTQQRRQWNKLQSSIPFKSPLIFLGILLRLYVANNKNPELDNIAHPSTHFFPFFKQRDVKDPFWPLRKNAFEKRRCKDRWTWEMGRHFTKALCRPHELQSTPLFWQGGWIFQKHKVDLISHFWVIAKLEEDATTCNNIRCPFRNAWKQKPLKSKMRQKSPLLTAGDTRVPPPVPNTKTDRWAACEAGTLHPTERSLIWRHFSTIMASSSLSCFIESKIWIKDRYW